VKLPISWLREWVEVDATPEQVAEALTTRGFYVESVEHHGRRYPGIVVGEVLEAVKHPNADKLKLCRVNAGGDELRIVCGAPNVAAGMFVPVATVGTTMPDGLVIKAARIRGEESHGMLCSARELKLSEDHSGIMELRDHLARRDLVPGTSIDTYFPEPDAVLEVETPFNRPDGMGVLGLAREVRAALGGRWTPWAEARLAARPMGADARVTFDLEVAVADDCPAYLAQVVEGVTVGPSPAWLVTKLAAMGQRSVNNLVDLTNLVLFELGQPLHAFDAARLEGTAIRVRRATAGETIVTLDGKSRTLSPPTVRARSPSPASWVAPTPRSPTPPPRSCSNARCSSRRSCAAAPSRSTSPPRPASATSAGWTRASGPPPPHDSCRCCSSSARALVWVRGASTAPNPPFAVSRCARRVASA
jgi:phenylalanyl-tRNA synthetase beta chain